MWVGRFNGVGGVNGVGIFAKSDISSVGRYNTLDTNNMRWFLRQFFASGNIFWATANSSFVFNKMYCLILTYDNSSNSNNPILYVNGRVMTLSKTDSSSSGDPTADATQNLYIGNTSANDRAGNLTLKEFRMDNKLWTPNEVSDLTRYAFRRYGFTA
jgi:hypothetical protein